MKVVGYLFVILCWVGFFIAIVNTGKYIRKVGLKHIVERVWEGENETK